MSTGGRDRLVDPSGPADEDAKYLATLEATVRAPAGPVLVRVICHCGHQLASVDLRGPWHVYTATLSMNVGHMLDADITQADSMGVHLPDARRTCNILVNYPGGPLGNARAPVAWCKSDNTFQIALADVIEAADKGRRSREPVILHVQR